MNPCTPLACLVTLLPLTSMADIPIASGQKVAFLGDSITQAGQGNPAGYVRMVESGLAANGVKIEVIGAGISGHKSNDMLKRLDSDVLSKKPDWMMLSCGVNDVWHGANGVPLDAYQQNITQIIDKAQAAGVKVVVLTATMIGEDQPNPNNQKLVAYNDFLRKVAAEKKCHLADLNKDMQDAVAAQAGKPVPPMFKLTSDGVHMAFAGNHMMALGILKGLGLNPQEISKAENAWLDIPNSFALSPRVSLNLRQVKQLEKLAKDKNTTLDKLVEEQSRAAIDALLKQAN